VDTVVSKLPALPLILGLLLAPGCFNHPLVGSEELPAYLGQATDDDGELDLASLSALIGAGALAEIAAPIPDFGVPATQITMFLNGLTTGAMGGLPGANAVCDSSRDKPIGTTAVAFLSSDSQDLVSLAGVPAALPVVGPNATVISTTWNGLFDGGIEASVFTAGVVAGAADGFFTGTNGGGFNLSGTNCTNWTAATGDSAVGRGDDISSIWMNWNDPTGQCAGNLSLLCVAW
jgi:hypothetical protein